MRAALAVLAVLPVVLVTGTAQARPGAASCKAGVEQTVGTDRIAYSAVVRRSAFAYRSPGGAPVAAFANVNSNGYPTTFSVVGAVLNGHCDALWYRVELPLRPNGAVGYVRPWAVELAAVHTRIVVERSAHRLTLYRDGRAVLHTVVAVGKSATPTPLGRFYVNQRLLASNPSGPYGPAALGVSAFSNVLTGWTQGGPIGIHGTNEPWLLGQSVSNGCIRLANAVVARLFALTPAGTPVIISG
jgi:lipoprotein-anchoring transpeptidase ErfK/SrfK